MVNLGGALAQGATIAIVIKAIDQFSNTFKQATKGTSKIAGVMKLATAAAVGFGIAVTAIGVSSIKAAADFEQTNVAFTTMLGSAKEAKDFLEDLADFAKKTPFTLKGVEKSAKQLLAVGFEAKEILPTLKSVGDVASGLGLGEEGLQRLILNLGQVRNQAKLTGRELRDFAVAGVPILDALATQLGITTMEVQDLVSKGEISSDMVTKAFKEMTSEGGKFANLMEKQAETVSGKFSNLQDTFELLKREVGLALLPVIADLADMFLEDLLPAIKPILPVLTDFIRKIVEKLKPFLPRITDAILKMVEVFFELFDAVSPLIDPLLEIALMILPAMASIMRSMAPIIRSLVAILTPLLEILAPIVQFITDLLGGIAKIAGSAIGSAIGFVGSIFGAGPSKSNARSVGDAILRPNGDIIETSPKDTIFATQGPMGGGINVYIERVQGIDAQEISEALVDSLSKRIRPA